jgi:hypothetical protein
LLRSVSTEGHTRRRKRRGTFFDTDPDLSDDCPAKPALDAAGEAAYQACEKLFSIDPDTYEGWMALVYYVDIYGRRQREKGHYDNSLEKVLARFRDIALRVAA